MTTDSRRKFRTNRELENGMVVWYQSLVLQVRFSTRNARLKSMTQTLGACLGEGDLGPDLPI